MNPQQIPHNELLNPYTAVNPNSHYLPTEQTLEIQTNSRIPKPRENFSFPTELKRKIQQMSVEEQQETVYLRSRY